MLTAHWTFAPDTVDGRSVLDTIGGPPMDLDGGAEAVPGDAVGAPGGGALSFDGTGRGVVPAAPQLVLNQLFGFTVAFSVLIAEPPTGEWRALFYKPVAEHDARGLGCWLYPDAMRLRAQLFTASGGGPEYADSRASFTVGDWVHLALVVDTEELYLYVDGVLDTAVGLEHPVVTPAGPIYLGRDPTGLGFSGLLADLRVYASALTAEAVAALQDR